MSVFVQVGRKLEEMWKNSTESSPVSRLPRAQHFKQAPGKCTGDGHIKHSCFRQAIHISNSCNEHLEMGTTGLRPSTPSLKVDSKR